MRCLKYAKWLLFPVFLWISLAVLFRTLPRAEQVDDDSFFAHELVSGRELRRVYHTRDFIPRENRLPRVRHRTHAALRFRYESEPATLRIAQENVLVASLVHAEESQYRSRLLAPFAKLGDVDRGRPSWLPTADAVLLHGFMSREWGKLLVAVERLPSEVEGEVTLQLIAARSATRAWDGEIPSVSLNMPALATFHFKVPSSNDSNATVAEPRLVRVSFPPAPHSYSPSRLFNIRKALVAFLYPMAMLVMTFADAAGYFVVIGLVFLGVLALIWILRELWSHPREADSDQDVEEGGGQRNTLLHDALREILGPAQAMPRGHPSTAGMHRPVRADSTGSSSPASAAGEEVERRRSSIQPL